MGKISEAKKLETKGVFNPFVRLAKHIFNHEDKYSLLGGNMFRDEYVTAFSWGIPNKRAIRAIANLSPIVEIGAGTGYWAHLIKKIGGHVTAYDDSSWRDMAIGVWHKVLRGSASAVKKHPTAKCLLLVWSPRDTRLAYNSLKHFKGKYVAYVGEGLGGCVADDKFHELLASEWELKQRINLQHWNTAKDSLIIYQRKSTFHKKS